MHLNLHHFIFDCHDCDPVILNDKNLVVDILTSTATLAKMHIIGKLSHQFAPVGVTAVLLLSESHIAIHTWPEFGFAVIVFSTCKTIPIKHVQKNIKKTFCASQVYMRKARRSSHLPMDKDSLLSLALNELTKRVNNDERYKWRKITDSETANIAYRLSRIHDSRSAIASKIEVPLPAVKLIEDILHDPILNSNTLFDKLNVPATNIPEPNCESTLQLLSTITAGRPTPKLELDQLLVTPATLHRRALYLQRNGDIDNRKIIFLGDDDHTSIAVALCGQPQQITVIDKDYQVLKHIREISISHDLNITTIHHDLSSPLPQEFWRKFDCVFCDPSYTKDGISIFLQRAKEAMKQEGGTCYLCYSSIDLSYSEQLEVQKEINNLGFVISEFKKSFNRYFSRSDMFNNADAKILPKDEALSSWYSSSLIKLVLAN